MAIKKVTKEDKLALYKEIPTSLHEAKNMAEKLAIAKLYIDSGLTIIKKPEQLVLVLEAGANFGLHPIIAMENLYVISLGDGNKITFKSSFITSLLKMNKIAVEAIHDNEEIHNDSGDLVDYKTTIKFYSKCPVRETVVSHEYTFYYSDAVAMGLTGKGRAMDKMQRQMMFYRAVTFGTRRYFPEVLNGFYTDIEIKDINPRSKPDDSYTIDIKNDIEQTNANSREDTAEDTDFTEIED